MITSPDNPQIKYIARLMKSARFRRQEGAFAAEGFRMVGETPRELLRDVYISESAAKEKDFPGAKIISDRVFGALSGTVTPQGILAVVKMPRVTVGDILEAPGISGEPDISGSPGISGEPGKLNHLLIFLENLQDPGNLGTILRTAEAAGATGIIADKNTVDLFNPKVVRSTMGAVYRMPFAVAEDLNEAISAAKARGITVYAAHLKGRLNYCSCDYAPPAAFIIGNEGSGLTEEIAGCADELISIPMEGRAESLNAAMAAGILLYEARRQRTSGWSAGDSTTRRQIQENPC